MIRVTRRWVLRFLLLLLAGGLAFLARPLHHLFRVAWRDEAAAEPLPPGVLDDASRMSATRVGELVPVLDQSDLIAALGRARADDLPVSLAGGRLSMGAQTLVADGIVLDMTGYGLVRYRPEQELLVAGAGATWRAVLEEADRHGRSPTHAPGLADATVGGTVSVNAYGWQVGKPPVGAGVVEMLVMLVDGALWRCSREQNAELFAAVLGGYGLFAIIVEVSLATQANRACRRDSELVPVSALADLLRRWAADEAVEMAAASISVLPGKPFDRAVATIVRSVEGRPPALQRIDGTWLQRMARRGAIDDDYGKWVNWQVQSMVRPVLAQSRLSRNSTFNRPVGNLLLPGGPTANLVLTLFVPPDELAAWLNQAGLILAGYETELLDIEVSYLGADNDSLLRYASRDLCAVRLLLNESRRPSGEYRLRELSMALIQRALALGGGFFLPHRRHASAVQFKAAYGNTARFIRMKRRFDPQERLQNAFYREYLQPLV